MSDNATGNYRSVAFINEPRLASSATIMRTPFGNVRALNNSATAGGMPPPLPPTPYQMQSSYGSNTIGCNTGYPMGMGMGMGMTGLSGYGYGGYGGYGGFSSGYGYGTYNRYGTGSYLNPNDPENQFIQFAEESSRPAFQSIESLVAAIGNIAAMLDSTFFAITSSFRAILGVAANFGRLRGVFAQFWHTFAIYRGLIWIYRKLLYWLRISKIDPSTLVFKEAFAAAAATQAGGNLPPHVKGQSPWPVLVFLSFIFTAPYVIMKLIGNISTSARQESRDPKKWVKPISSQVMYDFNARNSSELTIRAGQSILIAPKEIQQTNNLLNTGWALATLDNETSGLIPISYIQGPYQIRQQQQQHQQKLQQQQQQQQQQEREQEQKLSNELLTSNTEITKPVEENTIKEIINPIETEIKGDSTSVLASSSKINTNNTNNHHHHHSNHSSPSSRRNSGSLPVIPEIDDNEEIYKTVLNSAE